MEEESVTFPRPEMMKRLLDLNKDKSINDLLSQFPATPGEAFTWELQGAKKPEQYNKRSLPWAKDQ